MQNRHCKPAFERADPERKQAVLEAGLDQFSRYGFEKANINVIAKEAGISIGLMYKYFETKEDFFLTCLDEVIRILDESLTQVVTEDDTPMTVRAEMLIRKIQEVSREDSRFHKLYNEVTHLSQEQGIMDVQSYAEQIEGISARMYTEFLREARERGEIRGDADDRMFAFFFDSLLVTLQFSYTNDYYRERFKIYCGDDILDDDERVVSQLVRFLESAFAVSHEDIKAVEELHR